MSFLRLSAAPSRSPSLRPLALLLLCALAAAASAASLKPVNLRCEYLDNPLGLDVKQPRLSWQLEPTERSVRGQRQTGWHVLVSTSEDALARRKADLWDSGEQASDQSVHIPYAGRPLRAGEHCWWKLRVRDERGAWSPWTRPARWTMGPMEPSDWQANWIGADQVFTRKPGWPPPDNDVPDPWFRRAFLIPARPLRAMIHVASVGYHELYVNGRKVGDAVLAPCTSDHTRRARYVTYDLAPYLVPGTNVLGLWLGVSWSIFPPYKMADRPQAPIVIAQADIHCPGGPSLRIVTDETWKTHPSPNRLLGVWDFMHFGGELYDGTREIPNWCASGLDDSAWKPATVYAPQLELSAQQVEPNRLAKLIKPVAIEARPAGEYRVDFGVNFAGWTECAVRGQSGSRVDFFYSERAETNMTHRLHSALILGPTGQGTFRNRFNYSSGRWLTIRGAAARPALSDVRGWMVRPDYRTAASFECSDPDLNALYRATCWTFENLSLGGYLVDCPQRERMGYGGDAHATTEPGLNQFQLGALYTKWAQDWRDVQGRESSWGAGAKPGAAGSGGKTGDGNLPYTAPTYWGGGGPAWSGYCVTLPWLIYRYYGDTRLLSEQWRTIERWLTFLETKSAHDRLSRWGGEWDFLGDWLWPGAKGVNGDTRETLFFNNCYWIYNLQTAARIADVLGKAEAAGRLRQRADQVQRAVHAEFYRPDDHSYVNGSQAYLAIALAVDLPPAELRPAVWQRFEREILDVRRGHIHAGITGGAFVLKTLLDHHRVDLMHTMAVQKDYPGWLHMLQRGATTLWEDWEGNLSLLHSSYLHAGFLFVPGLAGIQPDPRGGGYRHFVLRPALNLSPRLTSARADLETLWGTIHSEWIVRDGRAQVRVTVPPNTTATLYLPATPGQTITEGRRPAAQAQGVKLAGVESGSTILELQPGHYSFEFHHARMPAR